jgi:hypothetical protein
VRFGLGTGFSVNVVKGPEEYLVRTGFFQFRSEILCPIHAEMPEFALLPDVCSPRFVKFLVSLHREAILPQHFVSHIQIGHFYQFPCPQFPKK